jgi:hypothetical protein
MSDINVANVLDEINSGRVTLVCSKHNYVAARKRANGTVAVPPVPNGCKQCWENFYVTDLALTPPNKRQERLDELEQVIHHAVEYEKRGQFGRDFDLFEPGDERFRVHVQRDAADDETGQDKVPDKSEEALN